MLLLSHLPNRSSFSWTQREGGDICSLWGSEPFHVEPHLHRPVCWYPPLGAAQGTANSIRNGTQACREPHSGHSGDYLRPRFDLDCQTSIISFRLVCFLQWNSLFFTPLASRESCGQGIPWIKLRIQWKHTSSEFSLRLHWQEHWHRLPNTFVQIQSTSVCTAPEKQLFIANKFCTRHLQVQVYVMMYKQMHRWPDTKKSWHSHAGHEGQ